MSRFVGALRRVVASPATAIVAIALLVVCAAFLLATFSREQWVAALLAGVAMALLLTHALE